MVDGFFTGWSSHAPGRILAAANRKTPARRLTIKTAEKYAAGDVR
jgi:hypothetical protein